MAHKGTHLDRRAYAEARAIGLPRSRAARIAGSRSKRVDVLSRQGGRLEAESEVQRMIAEAREVQSGELRDDWLRAKEVMRGILDDPSSKDSDKLRVVDIFAKVGGHYAPKKREVSGKITSAMDLGLMLDKRDAEAR